jgi:hypothetical protein
MMFDFQLEPNFVSAQSCFDLYLAPLEVVFLQTFNTTFSKVPRCMQHFLSLPSLWALCKAIDFWLAISIAQSSIASATSVLLPSIVLFVLHVVLILLYDVETDS